MGRLWLATWHGHTTRSSLRRLQHMNTVDAANDAHLKEAAVVTDHVGVGVARQAAEALHARKRRGGGQCVRGVRGRVRIAWPI